MATAKTAIENWITPQRKRVEVCGQEHFISWPSHLGYWKNSSEFPENSREWYLKEGPVLTLKVARMLETRESPLSSWASLSSFFVWTPYNRIPDFWKVISSRLEARRRLGFICVNKWLSLLLRMLLCLNYRSLAKDSFGIETVGIKLSLMAQSVRKDVIMNRGSLLCTNI